MKDYGHFSRQSRFKNEMASRSKLSGMQKQVLGLYRDFLRAARKKPPEERNRIQSIISSEFHEKAKNVDRKNFLYIEYLMRRGKKQLEQLNNPETVSLSTFKFASSSATINPSLDNQNSNISSSELHAAEPDKEPAAKATIQ
ncbi:succinate dehydrogenase assembly factor 1 protein [Dioscorea alata]|uniref:Succinate dehydrogenase assembly factor 1 protein n=3 Tax=Dioscorea alata TaxID=55571 RepID=A0ACB7UI17_DIOAL|nr:succinate dehydrogenase assembly factor 1 protein [Dioscorea alata]